MTTLLTVIGLVLGMVIAILVTVITVGLTLIWAIPTPIWVALILFWLYRRKEKKAAKRAKTRSRPGVPMELYE